MVWQKYKDCQTLTVYECIVSFPKMIFKEGTVLMLHVDFTYIELKGGFISVITISAIQNVCMVCTTAAVRWKLECLQEKCFSKCINALTFANSVL